jgi:hypothetical protein
MGNTRNTGYLQNIVQYDASNNVILPSLTGTGSRMVISSSTGVLSAQDIPTLSALGGVPTSRTLTINGVSYDLSANRSWSALPIGGTTGQILTKNSGTDYDAAWMENYADWTAVLKHRVKASEAITKGQAVYVSSADGTNMIVSKASNATEGTSSKTMGLLESTVSTNGIANVITEGLLAGLNTASANAGDPVWLGTGGNLIYGLLSKPIAPAHLVFIGVVTRSNANNGEIFVKVQNGFEFGELHDYVQTGVLDNYVISYESSTSLYKPKSIATLLGYIPANAARTITINGTSYDLSADRSWTINSMIYPGAGIAVSTGTAWGTSLTDNSSNWNTAYGWGNHASAGYATTTYVGTQIANLVASSPATLDTLNELAAALGNDAAFSTTVSTALGNRLRVDTASQGLSATLQGYGRTNLGLGTAATSNTGDFVAYRTFGTAANNNTGDFAAASHTHSIANVTGLQTALDGKQASGSYAAATHSHIISDVTGLQTALDGKQASLGFTPYNSTNPSGYISSYTETDTLQSVILRNSTTNTGFTITNTNDTYSTAASTNVPVIYLYNTGTTASANAIIALRTNTATGGDPILAFDIGGVIGWSMGIDNSDSDKFKIARSWASLDSETRFSMALDGTANFTGSLTAANLSGTNTGDQTNISGNAATATNVAWTGVTSRPTALSQFTNDLGNYGGWITSYTETDTLGTVTGRGASTATAVTFSGGLNVASSKVGFRNAGLTEFIQGESWTTGFYGYNSNDGFLFYHRDTSDVAHPCFHIGAWNNAAYGGYTNADSMITLVRGDGTKTDGGTYATRGLSSSSYYSNIIKTTGGTIFKDSQSSHTFTGSVVVNGTNIYTAGDGGAGSQATVVAIRVRGYNAYESLEIGTENNYDGVIRSYGNDIRYYAGHWRTVGNASSENHSHYWYTSRASSTDWANHKMRLDHNGVLTVASHVSTPGNLHTNRGRIAFSSTPGDGNHTIYNNYNNIDGEGSFDGMKMNVYAGLFVRTGNGDGAVPTTVLDVTSTRTSIVTGQLWCGVSNSRDGAVGLVLNDGALHVRAHNDFYHKIWYYDGIAFGTNSAHGHFRFYAESATQRGSTAGGATLRFDMDSTNGNFWAGGDVTAYSDARVKTDVKVIENSIEKIQAIRGVTFLRSDAQEQHKEERHAGVIAQEILEVLPEVVTENEDGMYSVAYGNMAGLFIEAIKELKAENDAQKSEIDELKDLVKQLINR